MTDPITMGIGIAGLFVAGVTAVANMGAAYGQYRANHPRRNNTGRVDNYTAHHQGYSMMNQFYAQPVPIFQTNMYTGQPQPQPQPQIQPSYPHYAHQFSNPTYAYPIHQLPPPPPPPPRSPSFVENHFPGCTKAVNRMLGRTSTDPQLHVQVPDYYPRSNSAPALHTPFSYHGTGHSSHGHSYGHGCRLVLSKEQQSRDTLRDSNIGMHTGRMPGYNRDMAWAHWSQFQNKSVSVAEGTIAVVNWSERSIAMYVYSQQWGQYFLNYEVHQCDLEAFGNFYFGYQVFTGILKDSWLVGCNDDLKLVEDDGYCEVTSSNCWSLLGIQGSIPGDLMFVEMQRAALFGLIQCRSKDPTLLNVDMVGDERIQFVHVDTEYKNLETKGNCWFSVFSFKTNGWAEQRVLVG